MAPLIQGKLIITDSVINVTKVRQIWENMINNQQLPPDLALCPLGFNGLFLTSSYLINITKTLKDFNIVSSCIEENGSHSGSINTPSHGNGGGNHNLMAIFAFYSMLGKLSLGLRVISIASLLLTVTTLLSFRKLRERQSNIIISLLSFNKICRYVFKIIKVYVPGSIIVCKIVMAVDHYFSMSTVLWMTILAIRLYYELIGVYSAIHRMSLSTEKVIFIAGSFAWGVPLIVITVGLLLNSGQYGMMYHRSCATHSKWITATYVYPMFVLVGINVLIFITICFKVWKLSKERNIPMTFSRFYSIIGLMSLFGLTWLVGILAFFDTSLWRNLSHLLFAILAGSQGFLIFVFYCVVKREVRNCWAKTFFKQIDKNTFTMSNRSGTDTNLQSLSSKSKLSKNNAVHPSPNGHFTF
ncbi:uncharacterized protein TRIADDRAFT_54794 [Trichoplax adhaerens]|uniref:G-protein coupled receptors family 2 profile 2 domain-containing protein n=1 Tax=Trichoplax adhaerens TaxID=10228 RepID=B3RT08_TRIAD|nr:hypothetical protein TRIADDRAFT_54794 [Trichoplax adhaerens]EDV26613.1 hypothetical protein TRIADDRAFT_54794 [Trichoplax adhaerens]|eukprot:XP_002110609.1 hypothetical protein TRIADDRAFT_54794 [Trichoplax adhaerens]